MFQKYVEKIQV